MHKIILKVLQELEKNGYEAYIVGGFVRDVLVDISSYDIDICTNATPRELLEFFPNASKKNLGGIDFKKGIYHFEITTYRKEIKYKGRKPIEFIYVNNLLEDLMRRDFTINAICMNSNGEIIDLVNGMLDLKNKKIKMIGNALDKVVEDPLRMLRGIRIATTLNFNLDSDIFKAINKHYKKILTLSNTRIRGEFDKILLSSNVKKGLNLLEEFHILKLLNIKNNENIISVKSLEGMYAQLEFDYDFPFTREEKNNIIRLKEIIKGKEINKEIVYHYGLYLSLIAGEILNIDKKVITTIHEELPIHDKKDIIIKAPDIVKELNISYSQKISIILNKIENLIVDGVLENNKEAILGYIHDHKSELI